MFNEDRWGSQAGWRKQKHAVCCSDNFYGFIKSHRWVEDPHCIKAHGQNVYITALASGVQRLPFRDYSHSTGIYNKCSIAVHSIMHFFFFWVTHALIKHKKCMRFFTPNLVCQHCGLAVWFECFFHLCLTVFSHSAFLASCPSCCFIHRKTMFSLNKWFFTILVIGAHA